MTEHDDRDREAIMARRRRFIALALGGLTTGCAPGKPKPTPSSTSTSGSDSESGPTSTSGATDSSDDESMPTTGFKLDLPPDPDTDTGDDESGSETGTPRPCLAPLPGLEPED